MRYILKELYKFIFKDHYHNICKAPNTPPNPPQLFKTY